jgi:hypothetical protein
LIRGAFVSSIATGDHAIAPDHARVKRYLLAYQRAVADWSRRMSDDAANQSLVLGQIEMLVAASALRFTSALGSFSS